MNISFKLKCKVRINNNNSEICVEFIWYSASCTTMRII